MSDQDRAKWNERYRALGPDAPARPSPIVLDTLARMRQAGAALAGLRALDLACGAGRNAVCLAADGLRVDAVDVAAEGIELGRQRAARAGVNGIRWIRADLDEGLPIAGPYDLILMIRYLDLELLERLATWLAPGGWLVVEVHARSNVEIPGVSGPRNPAYLARPDSVRAALGSLIFVEAAEGLFESAEGGRESLIRIIARRVAN